MSRKISVVTINLNNKGGLQCTMDSILSQGYDNLEYIVVDGNSSDGSLNIIEQHRGRIDKLIVEKDSGPYNAMNKALDFVTGDYVIFVNSGDRLVEGILNKVFGNYQGFDDLVFGDYYVSRAGVSLYVHKVSHNPGIVFFFKSNLNHQSTFIRTELHQKFRYDESLRIAADFKLFFNLILRENCSVHHVGLPIAIFDLAGISSQSNHEVLHQKERWLVLNSYLSPTAIEELNELSFSMQSPIFKYINRFRDSKKLELFSAKLLSFMSKMAKNSFCTLPAKQK